MRRDADLSLRGFGRMTAELLERLGLDEVTLVQNDHGAALALAGDNPQRVARLVVSCCEAFDNYPPGLPGKNLRLAAMVPVGLFVAMPAMRWPVVRRSPLGSGRLCAGGAASWAGKATSPHGPCGGYVAGAGASLVWRMNSRMTWANAAGWSRMMSV